MAPQYFIIGGERRCGTTSLRTTLNQHPEICLHPSQDKAWFVDDTVRVGTDGNPAAWENTHRREDYLRWLAEGCPGNVPVVGEKSADYLFWKPTHERLARMLPGLKMLVVLRDPVKRAWSHYWNEVAKKRENLSFEEAIRQESERLQQSDIVRYNHSYLARGDYADSLAHLFQHVPREQVMVITLEHFIAHEQETLAEICRFLGVQESFSFRKDKVTSNDNWAVVPKPAFAAGFPYHIAGAYGTVVDVIVRLLTRDKTRRRRWRMRAKSPFFVPARHISMPEEVRAMLVAHFRPRKARLEELLRRQITEWSF